MPHIIVKLWPGKSDEEKRRLSDEIAAAVCNILHYGEESVSVGFEEVSSSNWTEKVYNPDIVAKADTLFKRPGYGSLR